MPFPRRLGLRSAGLCLRLCVFYLALAALPAIVEAADDDGVSYQGVLVQPGDVINFHKGGATTLHFLVYGHTALFLGRDATGKPQFLDFSTTKGKAPYFGRILAEGEFLAYNEGFHPSFDVYRLRDQASPSPSALLREAETIAKEEWWGPFGEYCSSAVAAVLARATGRPSIPIKTPDGFTHSSLFQKHPALAGKTINVAAAIREARVRELEKTARTNADAARAKAAEEAAAELADIRNLAGTWLKKEYDAKEMLWWETRYEVKVVGTKDIEITGQAMYRNGRFYARLASDVWRGFVDGDKVAGTWSRDFSDWFRNGRTFSRPMTGSVSADRRSIRLLYKVVQPTGADGDIANGWYEPEGTHELVLTRE